MKQYTGDGIAGPMYAMFKQFKDYVFSRDADPITFV